MPTPANMVTVNELRAKLDFLVRSREASERGDYTNSISGFANRIMKERVKRRLEEKEIPHYRNTLLSAAEKDRIDEDTEKIIAEICRFDRTGTAWRIGSRKDFENEFSGVQFLVSRIRYAPMIDGVSVQAFFPQGGKPAAWPFDIEIVCQPALLPEIGLRVAINRITLRMEWDEPAFPLPHASRARDRETRVMGSAETLAKKRIDVTVLGDDRAPAWVLSHQDSKPVGIISLDSCSDLHTIEDGLEVFFSLTIYDKELNAEIASSAFTGEAELPSITRADGQPLGSNKLKVLQAIAARSLKDADQPAGSARLASDGVKFKKR